MFIRFLPKFFFLKKEEPAQVGTPIHHTLLYAKMFYKMGLAFSYTYRATETEPTELILRSALMSPTSVPNFSLIGARIRVL